MLSRNKTRLNENVMDIVFKKAGKSRFLEAPLGVGSNIENKHTGEEATIISITGEIVIIRYVRDGFRTRDILLRDLNDWKSLGWTAENKVKAGKSRFLEGVDQNLIDKCVSIYSSLNFISTDGIKELKKTLFGASDETLSVLGQMNIMYASLAARQEMMRRSGASGWTAEHKQDNNGTTRGTLNEDLTRADVASLGLVSTNVTSNTMPGYGAIRKMAIDLNKAISTWEFFIDPTGGPFVDIPMMGGY